MESLIFYCPAALVYLVCVKYCSSALNVKLNWLCTMIQKWNSQWKKLCRLYCLSELAVLILIFYSYNSVSDLRFSLVVEQCNSKQVCCRKTIETTQFFSLSVSLLYHSDPVFKIWNNKSKQHKWGEGVNVFCPRCPKRCHKINLPNSHTTDHSVSWKFLPTNLRLENWRGIRLIPYFRRGEGNRHNMG